MSQKPKIIAFSDTHGLHNKLIIPKCDIVIFAGDFSACNKPEEAPEFIDWFKSLPARWKIFTPGNHDLICDMNYNLNDYLKWTNYVEGKGIMCLGGERYFTKETGVIDLDGLRIYGSPYTPTFMNWAFMKDRGESIKREWDKIPKKLDILITHGPPYGILDQIFDKAEYVSIGCEELKLAVEKVRPKIHLFGHIHNGYGFEQNEFTKFYNVSVCNEGYFLKNPITEIDI
jgi:Icc-related predicted phosphoesterase